MKLLKVIIVLSSLLLSAPALAGDKNPKELNGALDKMPMPVFLGEDIRYSEMGFFFTAVNYMKFRLNKSEKHLHKSAVFFMINNAENCKIVSWYSKKRLVNGKVRVIVSYPVSGGYCRTYQSYIKVNGKSRHMTNIACKSDWATTWAFYK